MNARATSMSCAAVCFACSLPEPSAAQAGEPAAPAAQRVEITGSLLPRAGTETALPVMVLTADDLAKAGVRTFEDAMQLVAQNQTIVGAARSVSTLGAASLADLRGLGPAATLVLVNGQRVVKGPYREWGVDLNTLPAVAIERIEVLTDGASSTYGTDAVAGVVNVITRREYEGGQVGASVRAPQHAGGEQYGVNLIGGLGSLTGQGYNVYAGLDGTRQGRIRATDRAYASRVYQPERGYEATRQETFPGNYSQLPAIVLTNPALPGCRPPQSIYIPAIATNACRHDTKSDEDVTPDIERWSLLARGTLAFGDGHTAAVEYWRAYSRTEVSNETSAFGPMTMTASSPYFPGGAAGVPITDPAFDRSRPISVTWRTVEVGPRRRHEEVVTQRLLAEVQGRYAVWHYRLSAHASRADADVHFTNGFVNARAVADGVRGTGGAPFLNPFGPQSDAGLAYLEASEINGRMQRATGSLHGANGVFSGDLAQLPAGPLAFAVGAEVRQEKLEFRNDFSLTRIPGSTLTSAEDTAGRLRSRAVFTELNLPLLRDAPMAKRLEASLAVRHDDYERIIAARSPKLAARWQVSPPLLIRASLAHGFILPPVSLLYGTSRVSPISQRRNDPLLCPGGVPVAGADPLRDCNALFNVFFGANADLKPSRSRSWLAGFVVDVTSDASVSVDYFHYDIDRYPTAVSLAEAFNDPVTFAAHFVRCRQLTPERAAAFGCMPASVDSIAYIDQRWMNGGRAIVRGVDLGVNAHGDIAGLGRLRFKLNASYWDRNAVQVLPGGVFREYAGRYAGGIGSPRWQYVAQLGWERGAWSARLVNRFKSGYRDSNEVTLDPAVNHRVGHWSVFDATVTFRGSAGRTLTAGLLNVFDQEPPFSNQRNTIQDGYDPRIASPLGRALFLQASYRFR